MLRRKEEEGLERARSTAATAYNYVVNTAASASTTTVMTTSGQVLTVSEFIAQFDEAARRRLDRMNEKLRGLEKQMEALETEMKHAYGN